MNLLKILWYSIFPEMVWELNATVETDKGRTLKGLMHIYGKYSEAKIFVKLYEIYGNRYGTIVKSSLIVTNLKKA